jgi:hypothetical protein
VGFNIPGLTGKWRGSDGSECIYDEDGNLQTGGSYNYCDGIVCHILIDVLPHYLFGPGAGGATQYGYP